MAWWTMAWHGGAWVWRGVAWHGGTWYGMAWPSHALLGVWHPTACPGSLPHGMPGARQGMARQHARPAGSPAGTSAAWPGQSAPHLHMTGVQQSTCPAGRPACSAKLDSHTVWGQSAVVWVCLSRPTHSLPGPKPPRSMSHVEDRLVGDSRIVPNSSACSIRWCSPPAAGQQRDWWHGMTGAGWTTAPRSNHRARGSAALSMPLFHACFTRLHTMGIAAGAVQGDDQRSRHPRLVCAGDVEQC